MDTAPTELSTLSLHDALPISLGAFYFFFRVDSFGEITGTEFCTRLVTTTGVALVPGAAFGDDRYMRLSRSEEHTSELQSRLHLVCRLLLEKKKHKIHS